MVLRLLLLLIFSSFATCAERGDSCTTPNGEQATCTELSGCAVIYNAIKTYNRNAIQFAKNSQCGYDTEALVCCGSSAYITTITRPSGSSSRPNAKNPTTGDKNINTANNPDDALPNRSVCGLHRDTDRVVGGYVTTIDEYPWMALIRYNKKDGSDAGFRCGGTLINKRYVLTAAHCVLTSHQDLTPASVRLGEWNISTTLDCIEDGPNIECADAVKDINVEAIIAHTYYNRSTGNNDIALIRLSEAVDYTDFIRPVCVPSADLPPPPVGTELTACGWGVTENSTSPDDISKVKVQVKLPLVSNTQCAEKIQTTFTRTRITRNQICAGGEQGKDTCQGDSGGPLMREYADYTEEQKTQWYQEGIVSKGLGCGRQGFPGVYTRVTRYINWLLSNIQP